MSFELDEAALELLAGLKPCNAQAQITASGVMTFTKPDGEKITPDFQFHGTYLHDIVWEVNENLAKLDLPDVHNWWLLRNSYLQGETPMSLVGTEDEETLLFVARALVKK